jgi:hypothetical protein
MQTDYVSYHDRVKVLLNMSCRSSHVQTYVQACRMYTWYEVLAVPILGMYKRPVYLRLDENVLVCIEACRGSARVSTYVFR